jgi:hypothetical protein
MAFNLLQLATDGNGRSLIHPCRRITDEPRLASGICVANTHLIRFFFYPSVAKSPSPCGEVVMKVLLLVMQQVMSCYVFPSPCGEVVMKEQSIDAGQRSYAVFQVQTDRIDNASDSTMLGRSTQKSQ